MGDSNPAAAAVALRGCDHGSDMIVSEMRCGMCGGSIEVKLLDRKDPKCAPLSRVMIRCPNCNSSMMEDVRVIRGS